MHARNRRQSYRRSVQISTHPRSDIRRRHLAAMQGGVRRRTKQELTTTTCEHTSNQHPIQHRFATIRVPPPTIRSAECIWINGVSSQATLPPGADLLRAARAGFPPCGVEELFEPFFENLPLLVWHGPAEDSTRRRRVVRHHGEVGQVLGGCTTCRNEL